MNLDLKQLLKFKQDQVLGLDIGSSAVKIVRLSKDNTGYVATAAGMVDIDAGTEADDDQKQINTLKAIRLCLQSARVQTRMAVCSVSGPEIAVRSFQFPLLPLEEIEGAVLLEAGQVCPFNIETSTVDYQLVSNSENNINGVLVSATNRLIKNKNYLAQNSSLKNVLTDVDGLALLNCFSELALQREQPFEKDADARDESCQDETSAECRGLHVEQTIAILNIGSSFTNLAIIGNNGLPFVRDIAYAGNDIVKQIATERSISAEAVKMNLRGNENPDQEQPNFSDNLPEACRKLIVDVVETLRYYAAQENSTFVEKILLCGGFALTKGLLQVLDSQLPAPVVLWNPFDDIRCNTDQLSEDMLKKNGPALAVAAGLAMRSI